MGKSVFFIYYNNYHYYYYHINNFLLLIDYMRILYNLVYCIYNIIFRWVYVSLSYYLS